MIIVTLTRIEKGDFDIKQLDGEHRVFSTMDEAESWLKDNNFYFGQRDFFKYENDDDKEWCHEKDESWEFIDVQIDSIDDVKQESRYKNFVPQMAPWLKAAQMDGFAEGLSKCNIPNETRIKIFANYFDVSEFSAKWWLSSYEKSNNE